MQEVRKNTVSELVVQLLDYSGAPKTGAVKGDVDPYYRKMGGASTQLPGTDFDWTEIDSTNMPGLYLFTFNATAVANNVLDTLGQTTIVLNDQTGGVFSRHQEIIIVTADYSWLSLQRILGLNLENAKLKPTAVNSAGFMTTGTLEIYEDNGLTTLVATYNVAVTYSPANVLQLHQVTKI
jgi:hypothetical protein